MVKVPLGQGSFAKVPLDQVPLGQVPLVKVPLTPNLIFGVAQLHKYKTAGNNNNSRLQMSYIFIRGQYCQNHTLCLRSIVAEYKMD